MSDLQEISRVLYRHDWTSIDQWAATLDRLADLTDDDIVEVERLGRREAPGSRGRGDRRAAGRRGLEGGRSFAGFWRRALFSARRRCSLISAL